ncbi:ribosomal L11 methyltransferase [Pyrolobus fumarii 1A]|uniref:Ribosomal L11 methyltransferase n=1 Tax=Pyrolobus fumarii (strain DSM 11204 / 1A) TaxID=694429 RepID=G0EDS2_PYRF1|nr:ribosomal L11 methyltransferase [Pyrolobus fumarii 1A]
MCTVEPLYEIEACNTRVTICRHVYEPSTDTWLAMQVLEKLLATAEKPRIVLDVGTGTGILAACASLANTYVVAIDVSPCAAKCARMNLANTLSDVVQCDNLTCIRPLHEVLVVYNTPYLPVEDGEELGLEALAWSGGAREAIRTMRMMRSWGKGWRALLVAAETSPFADILSEAERLGLKLKVEARAPEDMFNDVIVFTVEPG